MATMIRDIGDRMVQALDDLKNGKITPQVASRNGRTKTEYCTQTNGGEKMKPMTERDEKGRATHERRSDGDEYWYDAAGHITHTRFGDGIERWYDAAGNITHVRLSDGDERWYDYDADGRVTKWKDKNGSKIKKVTSEMIDGMRAAYKDGKPLAEILKEFGVSGATFYAHVEKSRNKKRTE